MKNFTLLMALCATLFTVRLVAQPTMAPTAPTKAAADVISVLTAVYPNRTVTSWRPDWGQGTTFVEFPLGGDAIKKYGALDYEGVDFEANPINASSMTNMHWDIWTDVATTLRISLIGGSGGGERYVTYVTSAGWNSFDVPLTDYTSQAGFSVSNLIQFKFEEFPMAYKAGTKSVYLYNIYFWKPANVPTLTGFTVPAKLVGDAAFALTAPTSPSSGAFTYESSNMSVATISGSTVTIVGAGTSTITANQAAAGAYAAGSTGALLTVTSPGPQAAAPTPTKLAANVTSLFSNAYTNVGIDGDKWSADWDAADVADVTIAGNATKKYTNHTFSGIEFTGANLIDATSKTHFHLDVWTADAAGTDGFKVKLVDFGANGIYQGMPNDDVASIELPFTPTASGWFSVDVPLTSFTGLTTKAHLAQLVLVTAPGKTFWLDNVYFYNDPAVGPTQPTTAAPTPTLPVPNVLSLFSGGAYTDLAGLTWNKFNAGTTYEDVMIAGNTTQKYTNMGYSVSEPAAPIDGTRITNMHMDVWSPVAAVAGAFKMKLVDFGTNGGYGLLPGDDVEGEVGLPALAAATWTSIDIPLADFTAAGMTTKAHIAQIIPSGPGGATLFMDNLYFSAASALAVELTNFKAKAVNATSVLTWTTASEKDNARFTIERSNDGRTYTSIGEVKGNGTTSTVSNYNFTDATPATGVNYYRLRQADFDGKETLSKIASVVFAKSGLFIKNTLVHDVMDITVGDAEKGPLSIFNVSGQLVYSIKVQGNQQINLSALTAGLYIVRTSSGAVSRFVKD